MLKKIILVEHQDCWAQDFKDEKLILQKLFNHDDYTDINHIGLLLSR